MGVAWIGSPGGPTVAADPEAGRRPVRRRAFSADSIGRWRKAAALTGTVLLAGTSAACGSGFLGGSSPGRGLDTVAESVALDLVVVDSVLGHQQVEAAGTGIVLSASGEVLTNNHVIAGATSITVTDIGNGNSYQATVVGFDRSHDIAVLSLSGAHGLAPATLAAPATAPAVGDPVVAIGNAGGTGTLTGAAGTITGLDKSITAVDTSTGSSEQLTGLIQTSADVLAGDSGGPLVDASGRVIGVDTAATEGFHFQQAAQAGFAIPIGVAAAIAAQIEAGHPTATIHIGPTAILGVQVSANSPNPGAVVAAVVPGSPADQAGITAGAVITALDGTSVDSATALTALMDRHSPGQKAIVQWTASDGNRQSATLTLANGPAG